MDLATLRPAVEAPGPYATVVLDASHDTEDAAHALALRWAQARSELAEQGADTATLDALEAGATAPAPGRAGRVLVARGGTVVLDRLLPEPPAAPTATWAPLPDLLPAVADLPEPLTAVVVRVDQTGGEILLAQPGDGAEPVERVRGADHPVHKVRAGGWSHLNMQERVEETWRRNASELAGRVDALVAGTGARLVVLAGDVQARTLLHAELGSRSAALAVEVEHSAAASDSDLEAAVEEAARDLVTADRLAVLERYAQADGRGDGFAVDGVEPVLEALRGEQVDVLLLDAGVERDLPVWIAQPPTVLATDPAQIRALGAEPLGQVAADAALLRAAAASGARLCIIGGGRSGLVGAAVADGVAALLRYPVAGAGLDPDPGPDQDAEPTMTAPPADRPDAGASGLQRGGRADSPDVGTSRSREFRGSSDPGV